MTLPLRSRKVCRACPVRQAHKAAGCPSWCIRKGTLNTRPLWSCSRTVTLSDKVVMSAPYENKIYRHTLPEGHYLQADTQSPRNHLATQKQKLTCLWAASKFLFQRRRWNHTQVRRRLQLCQSSLRSAVSPCVCHNHCRLQSSCLWQCGTVSKMRSKHTLDFAHLSHE